MSKVRLPEGVDRMKLLDALNKAVQATKKDLETELSRDDPSDDYIRDYERWLQEREEIYQAFLVAHR